MPYEPRGIQAARAVLRAQRYTTRQAAEAIGVDHGHLARAVSGRVRPSNEIRERLPELLGVPLEELFDSASLALPYEAHRGGPRPHMRKQR